MLKQLRKAVVRRGVETAIQMTTEAAATASSRVFRQAFEVHPPVTIFVRASHAEVKVQYMPGTHVELEANLRASFGWEFVAEQDEAGIYIIAKRKPVVGALSRASFRLIVPPEANLVLHLTPGTVRMIDVDGKLSIPGWSAPNIVDSGSRLQPNSKQQRISNKARDK